MKDVTYPSQPSGPWEWRTICSGKTGSLCNVTFTAEFSDIWVHYRAPYDGGGAELPYYYVYCPVCGKAISVFWTSTTVHSAPARSFTPQERAEIAKYRRLWSDPLRT